MAEKEPSIVYRIDARDNITFVNREWDRFALANDAPEMLSEKILNRSLWDFVTVITLRHLYRQILGRVREGQIQEFDFRCDSPDARRFLNMGLIPVGNGSVEFRTRTIRIEKRAALEIFRKHCARAEEIIVACSWCNKIKVGEGQWREAEEAITMLGIFGDGAVPMLTHGMCAFCHHDLSVGPRK